MRSEIYTGEGDEWEPPVSRAEQLMKAHPDIIVLRDITGDLRIIQELPDTQTWRNIWVNVEHEEGSQRSYPTVDLIAINHPRDHTIVDDPVMDIRRYGFGTIISVHTENDEQITPEVSYDEREQYPSAFSTPYIRYIERFAQPIPAREIVAAARIGLDMLKAYGEATREQRERIDNTWSGFDGIEQIVDQSRPDADEYLAKASPKLARIIGSKGWSFAHVRTQGIYALNVLNKVTDEMLPGEMPPAPGNRREPRRRGAPGVPPAPGRRPAGR